MRVLYAVHALPAAGLGGTELYTRQVAETLAESGGPESATLVRGEAETDGGAVESHEAAVATPRGHAETTADVPVYPLPDDGGWTDPTGTESGLDREVVDEAVDQRFADVLDSFDPDIVHLQHLKFTSARLPEICRSRGIPCVLTLHDFWTICHREQLYRPDGTLCDGPESVEKCASCYAAALRASNEEAETAEDAPEAGDCRESVERRTERLARARESVTAFVSPSRFLRRQFVRFGTPPEVIVHRRNGIRVDAFEDVGFDPRGPLRVGYAGRITRSKGVHTLLEAVRRVEGDVEAHLFGEFDPTADTYHASLRARAGPRATFHGRYESPSTPYEAVDVLVVPSQWYENSPLVIQEAFASGVPVLAGDVGGMAELVTHGEDGLTFDTDDPSALADCLRRLAASPSLVRRLREGVERPKSLGEHATELLDLYEACRDGRIREVEAVA